MEWETIDERTERARVHKGWLVKVYDDCEDERGFVSIAFVPDPMFAWAL